MNDSKKSRQDCSRNQFVDGRLTLTRRGCVAASSVSFVISEREADEWEAVLLTNPESAAKAIRDGLRLATTRAKSPPSMNHRRDKTRANSIDRKRSPVTIPAKSKTTTLGATPTSTDANTSVGANAAQPISGINFTGKI
jgi:hypothetical protein